MPTPFPKRISGTILTLTLIGAISGSLIPGGVMGQEDQAEEDGAESTEIERQTAQALVDIDALVVGNDVTTRCAVFDASITYLTPLEQVGATLRLRELADGLGAHLDDVPDRLARMHAEAATVPCGDPGLVPFMDFGRQVARDAIDIALSAWQDIDIDRCHYFADDDFMRAVERAHGAAETWSVEGAENRIAFIEQRAAAWIAVFVNNCTNLGFDPVTTLPGQIALALPSQ